MKTRNLVRAGAIAASLAVAASLTACGGGGGGNSEASSTLRVTMANHVWTTQIQQRIADFEKESGLKVQVTTYGEDQLSDQYKVKLNAGSNEIDVMMYRPLQEGRQFAKNKWLADLTSNVKDSSFNWDDFQQAARDSVTLNDKVVGVPLITEREVLYYNKAILAKAGVEVPKTLDELEAAAKKVKETVPDTFGFVARGQRAPAVTQFSSFLYSMGGDWTDKDGKSSVNTDAAKKAYTLYGNLLNKYGPPGAANMNWPDAFAIFQQGKAAFLTEPDSLYKNATDPAKSKVADSVGWAQFPAGPAGSKPYNVTSWALGVNGDSKNKDNAWKFIKWATSQDGVLKSQVNGVPGARASVWDNPEALKSFPADLAKVTAASAKAGVGHDRPEVIQVSKARDAVGGPIVAGIAGQDVAAATEQAQKDFQAVLDADK